MEMRALYYVALPSGREEGIDRLDYAADVKANENCLNQNFKLLADELRSLRALLEATINTK